MKAINERLKLIRDYFGLSQKEFSSRINVGQSTLAMFETGQRAIKDIHISQICSEFSVNEDWLRYGQGEMFVQPEEFSLDEYAKANNLSALEFDIVKGYMDLDSNVRNQIMTHFKAIFDKHSEIAATNEEDYIESEMEKYRLELEAELKGATSLASEDIEGSGEKTS